jgi:ankyrin repeat protein
MCAVIMMSKRKYDTETCKQSSTDAPTGRPSKMPRILMSALPDRMLVNKKQTSQQKQPQASPEETLFNTLGESSVKVDIQSYSSLLDAFFHPPTAEEIDAYKHDVIMAIRTQDLDTLRQFHAAGRPLKCSNKFGESLLHMACRKGFLGVTKVLVQEAKVPLAVCDDYGRTPLHDACWAHTTNFELIDLILEECPDLLYIQDKRGSTPLSYLRRDKWTEWNTYLSNKSADVLKPRVIPIKQL